MNKSPGAVLNALRKKRELTCVFCGKGFVAMDVKAMFCSTRCKSLARSTKHRKPKEE